jgi:AraC family transcriptional regulator of adaptative response/methylated-DNA-[protein]-cysteine methyltransferase
LIKALDESEYELISRVIGDTRRGPDRITCLTEEDKALIEVAIAKWAGVSVDDFIKIVDSTQARQVLTPAGQVLTPTGQVLMDELPGPDQSVNIIRVEKSERALRAVEYGFAMTPFGECLIAVSGGAVCRLSFQQRSERQKAVSDLAASWPRLADRSDDAIAASQAKNIFFRGDNTGDDILNLIVAATDFQITVWETLLRIPVGGVMTYGTIARLIGSPAASRAVGTAIGSNPIGYLIPCHRVVPLKNGTGNYRWGKERKRAMLCFEQAQRLRGSDHRPAPIDIDRLAGHPG